MIHWWRAPLDGVTCDRSKRSFTRAIATFTTNVLSIIDRDTKVGEVDVSWEKLPKRNKWRSRYSQRGRSIGTLIHGCDYPPERRRGAVMRSPFAKKVAMGKLAARNERVTVATRMTMTRWARRFTTKRFLRRMTRTCDRPVTRWQIDDRIAGSIGSSTGSNDATRGSDYPSDFPYDNLVPLTYVGMFLRNYIWRNGYYTWGIPNESTRKNQFFWSI